MKHLQLEITKDKSAGAAKVVEDRKKAAEEVEKVKTTAIRARKQHRSRFL